MKKALVTGAAGGIGSEISKLLAKNGFEVALCCNSSLEECEKLKYEIEKDGGKAHVFCGDISKESDVLRIKKEVDVKMGSIDVLVNNAGMAEQKMLWDISEADWDKMFGVNTKSVFLMCREFARDMVSFKYGRIINISSIWGVCGASCETHYSASKAAVIGFTKALSKELAPSGVTVNCIAPGLIDTKMNACHDEEAIKSFVEDTPLGRIGTPYDIASAVMFFAKEESGFVTGQVLTADGGYIGI